MPKGLIYDPPLFAGLKRCRLRVEGDEYIYVDMVISKRICICAARYVNQISCANVEGN